MVVASPIPTDKKLIHAPLPSGSIHTEFLHHVYLCLIYPTSFLLSNLSISTHCVFVLPPTLCTFHQAWYFFPPRSRLCRTLGNKPSALWQVLYKQKRKFGPFLIFLMLCCGGVNEPWKRRARLSSFPSLLCHWGMERGSERRTMLHRVVLYYLRDAWEMMIGTFLLFLQHAHWLDSTVALFRFLRCVRESDELCFSKRQNRIFVGDKVVTRVFAFARVFIKRSRWPCACIITSSLI